MEYHNESNHVGLWSAITLLKSTDGGQSWTHARPPPHHIVAAMPYRYEPTGPRSILYGFRSPSNIIRSRSRSRRYPIPPLYQHSHRGGGGGGGGGGDDGGGGGTDEYFNSSPSSPSSNSSYYYYATVEAGWGQGSSAVGQPDGACLMRTHDLTDPSSWRAWDGAEFNVSLAVNPYLDPTLVPSEHICKPVTHMTYPSLLWSTYYQSYLIMGTTDGNDHKGWSFQLLPDLAQPQYLLDNPPVPVQVGAWIEPSGNATRKPPPQVPVPGLWARSINGTVVGTKVFWLSPQNASKHTVGSCEPCPDVSACVDPVTGKQHLHNVPIEVLSAIPDGPPFDCNMIGAGGAGVSAYLYPSLLDESAPISDVNFETVGQHASLYLVTSECTSWHNISGRLTCSPWDSDGILHRSVVKVPIEFKKN